MDECLVKNVILLMKFETKYWNPSSYNKKFLIKSSIAPNSKHSFWWSLYSRDWTQSIIIYITKRVMCWHEAEVSCQTWEVSCQIWELSCETWEVNCQTWEVNCQTYKVLKGFIRITILKRRRREKKPLKIF